MKTTIRRLVSIAMWMSTRSGAYRFLHILLFSFLAVSAAEARTPSFCGVTGDIPFTVTLLGPVDSSYRYLSFSVHGPFLRTSGEFGASLLNVGEPCTFYAADDNFLSPFGRWSVVTDYGESGVQSKPFWLNRTSNNRVDITLKPVGNRQFIITVSGQGVQPTEAPDAIAPDGMNTVQQSQTLSPERELSVKAWIGDSQGNPPGTPDSDKFSFEGTAGDTVTVRLEADGQAGNNGGHASLRLLGPSTKEVTGTLPKRIDAELGSTGRYYIEVAQAPGQGQKGYSGGYILKVESSQGKIQKLVPTDSVEEE